jgi:hypothetical protein
MATATEKTRADIRATREGLLLRSLRSPNDPWVPGVLAIDPDKTHPGAAHWPGPGDRPARVWGGDKAGERLTDPLHVQGLLCDLSPTILVIEGPLAKGWVAALECIAVRGGWQWLAQLAGVPSIVVSPTVWQYAQHGPLTGKGAYKTAYKAHAARLCGVLKINEDRAAALGLLQFAVRALGHELPDTIQLGAPDCATRRS